MSEERGRRADPAQNARNHRSSDRRIGFDYVHVAVDDHSRFASARALPDEKGPTCATFLARAALFMAANGAPVQRVMTNNAWAYRKSRVFQGLLQGLGAKHKLITPRHPWQNGKVERFNRTLQEGWAYRRPYASNQEPADALAPLDFYNHHRAHSTIGGHPPISRCKQPAV